MRNLTLVLALVAVIGQAAAQQPQQVARLNAGQVFFAEPKIDLKAMHACQPLKGETVAVLEVKKNLEGMMGADVARVRVRVIDGQCSGKEGWVGVSRLESATR